MFPIFSHPFGLEPQRIKLVFFPEALQARARGFDTDLRGIFKTAHV